MESLFSEKEFDWEQIAVAFGKFLEFTKAQIEKALTWMSDNPDKVVLLVFAVSRAYRGDMSSLADIGSIILA
ncbi:MAG: hypothetical protein HRU09_21180 [Oligoflexales bacterium]|nr:hypothetical protein [Oligoflexales bacterium]